MWIDYENKVMSNDMLLRGFTIQELIDVANANGDSIRKAFELMLDECIEYANEMINMYGDTMEKLRKGE